MARQPDAVARNRLWSRLCGAVAAHAEHAGPVPTPIAVVDLDAFDANTADLARRAGGTPIRVASRSLRVPALIRRALGRPGFRGVLADTLAEALWLEENDVSEDIVVAYPTVDRGALARLVASPRAADRITLMVDSVDHLDVVDSVRTSKAVPVRVALDLDAGLAPLARVGPRRSPVTTAAAAEELARAVSRPGFRLVGVMAHEGPEAGVPDQVPGRLRSAVVRGREGLSASRLARRRADVAARLARVTELEFWNAAGPGSWEASGGGPAATELTAGSGLLEPGRSDHLTSFGAQPATFFGVPVTRRPDDRTVTVHGGGLAASGPAGADRLPLPWAPAGLSLARLAGAGEVQTPLTGPTAPMLAIGDLVWFRHRESGEPFEHTPTAHLLAGDRLVDHVPTYRGHGLAF